MKLVPIEKRSGLTREEFIENYLKPSRPVVFTDLMKDWPAIEKYACGQLQYKALKCDRAGIADQGNTSPGGQYNREN